MSNVDGKRAPDALERIIVEAMGWHPSENGPSYGKTKLELLERLKAALPAASPADPKPAPDVMREAYLRFPDDVEPVDYHPAGKIVVDRGNLRFAFVEGARFAVALSAPVPPPDGAAATLLVPASDDAATLAGSTERASICGHAPRAGTKTPPSDDVRSALADALEKSDWSNTSIGNKLLIKGAIAALRSDLHEHQP